MIALEKVDDDHAAIGVVVGIIAMHRTLLNRKLDARTGVFAALSFPIFPLPNLLDDEGR